MRTRSWNRSAVVRLLAAGLLVVLAGACSTQLTTAEWETEWNALLGELPSLSTVMAADEQRVTELCTDALGTLRTAAVDLIRAPEPDLERTALDYVDFAESVFFECPIRSGDHTGFEAGYEEMDRLQSVVEAILEFDE